MQSILTKSRILALLISGVVFLGSAIQASAADSKEAAEKVNTVNQLMPFQTVKFFAEPQTLTPKDTEPSPPSFEGKVVIKDKAGNYVPIQRPSANFWPPPFPVPSVSDATLADIYLQDGEETSVAVNHADGNNLIGVYNEGWNFNPDIPHSNSTNGNGSWTSRTFPTGGGTFTGYPFDPWANAGNTAGEFFSTLIRWDALATSNSHCIISRSTNNGASFSLFYEKVKAVGQDREMVDIDRTTALGGGTGTTHDGKVYLCYDDWGAGFTTYVGSFLQVVSSAGAGLTEVQVSGTGSPPFRGSQMQPVAGINDGQVYIMSAAQSGGGATIWVQIHEITNGGAGPNTFDKAVFSYAATGQQLGATSRYGLNGHRIGNHGLLDIDRSNGARRGYLYLVTTRNPNPGNSALDQGDIFVSVSTNGGSTWASAALPTAASKSQYFPMMDVDNNGWIHVAYYQNETGSVNGGVLNASSANVYYTVSIDGGSSWSSPTQINTAGNTLDYEDPPPDRAGASYYLVGDYAQLKADQTGTKVYVLWTGYDKDRSGTPVGNAKARVLCTTVTVPVCTAKPGDASANNSLGLEDLIAAANYIFNKSGCLPLPLCWLSNLLCRGDWEGNGGVALTDVIRGANYIFNKPGGPWTPVASGTCCIPVP